MVIIIDQIVCFAEFSVYATRPIVMNTKFGPIEGDLRCLLAAELELMKSDGYRRLPALFVNDNHLVDVSNECMRTWKSIHMCRAL